jgi:hypothetical protein
LTSKYLLLIEAMAMASTLVVIDLILGLILSVSSGTGSVLHHASNLLVLEFGIMLIVGGCLMSRQPLEDKKRYDESGKPTASWRAAMMGRRILTSSMFVLMFSILFAFAVIYAGL